VSHSDRFYRLLLRAYPRSTRDDLGRDMAQLFTDQVRDAGGSPRSVSGVWLRALADTLRTAPAERLAARSRKVAEGPSVDEPRRSWVRDLALASLPSLGLLLLWAGQPNTMGGHLSTPPRWMGLPVGLAIAIPFAAGQWLAALGAVRATTPGRQVLWLLACMLCIGGLVLGPGVLLILQNLASQHWRLT
jgi:hypothetical protein